MYMAMNICEKYIAGFIRDKFLFWKTRAKDAARILCLRDLELIGFAQVPTLANVINFCTRVRMTRKRGDGKQRPRQGERKGRAFGRENFDGGRLCWWV